MEAYNLSHWEWDSFFKNIDCLIVGSGIVGLSAAIRMKTISPKISVMIVDRGSLPIGASTRNAGFACFGSLSELIDDIKYSSKDEVLALVERRYAGLQLLRQRYSDSTIGYEAFGGYEVFRKEDEALYQNCLQYMDSFNKDMRRITQMETYVKADHKMTENGLQEMVHLLLNQAEGQLDTGRLMNTLLKQAQSLGIRLLGGMIMTDFTESNNQVHFMTDKGWTIKARKVLIATNGFAKELLPELDVIPARNQVLITKPVKGLRLKGAFHYDKGYVYFRNVENRILLGGARHLDIKGETTAELGTHESIRKHLENILHSFILPHQSIEIDRWWSGIMGVGAKKEPIVTTKGQNIVLAVRLGGMGVALGIEIGEEAADLMMI